MFTPVVTRVSLFGWFNIVGFLSAEIKDRRISTSYYLTFFLWFERANYNHENVLVAEKRDVSFMDVAECVFLSGFK